MVIFPSALPHEVSPIGSAEMTTGSGLTVMVYMDGVPAQPSIAGVTVIVDVMADNVVLVAVKLCTFPVPVASRPIEVFELAQL